MGKIIFFLSVIIITLADNNIFPQNYYSSGRIRIDEGLIYNIVIVESEDGTVQKGLLSGMSGDSLFIRKSNSREEAINLYKVKSVTVYDGRTSNCGLVYGFLSGLYAGNIIFYTEKNLQEKYISYSTFEMMFFADLAFATVGGIIGLLFDLNKFDEKKYFYFSGKAADKKQEIESIKNYLSAGSGKKNIRIFVDLGQVSTRLSSLNDKNPGQFFPVNYTSNSVHSFNLLRKVCITYMFFPNIELGGSICWFGEPDFNYVKYNSTNSYSNNTVEISETYKAIGYFLIANYHPLRNILPSSIEFSTGGGLGISNIDYRNSFNTAIYKNYELTWSENEAYINERKLSYIFMSHFNFHLYPELFLSVQADYVFVPGKKIPAINELSLGERNFGNFSVGIGFGLNF